MNLEVIERRLLGLDDEIHMILQYIYEKKKYDIASEINDYENLKKIISEHMKEPIDPTSEIRKMREKQYLV
jgi:DNA-binding SARP family transcriptional activator